MNLWIKSSDRLNKTLPIRCHLHLSFYFLYIVYDPSIIINSIVSIHVFLPNRLIYLSFIIIFPHIYLMISMRPRIVHILTLYG